MHSDIHSFLYVTQPLTYFVICEQAKCFPSQSLHISKSHCLEEYFLTPLSPQWLIPILMVFKSILPHLEGLPLLLTLSTLWVFTLFIFVSKHFSCSVIELIDCLYFLSVFPISTPCPAIIIKLFKSIEILSILFYCFSLESITVCSTE